jgi:hypothetical protein
MIDKSLKQHYEMQGGGPNYLGKQKMVKAPKKWKSSPDHDSAELAYITKKEKDILLALDIHNSLKDGKPNRGPSGIISLQGDLGGWSAPAPSGGGGNGGGALPPSVRARQMPVDTSLQRAVEQKAKDDAARVREILTRGRGTEIPGERLFEDRISKYATPEIKAEIGPEGQIIGREYNVEAIQKAAKKESVARALGIGDPLTTEKITSLPMGTRIEDFIPRETRLEKLQEAGSKFLPSFMKEGIGKKAKSWAGKKLAGLGMEKLGIAGWMPQVALPYLASKLFGKKDPLRTVKRQIAKYKVPGTDTQEEATKKLVKHEPVERDGIQQAITGETGLLKKGAETLGITEDQREQYLLMQKKMTTALGQGSYTNEQGQVIQLNEQQMDQLQNYIDKLDNILQTTLQTAAHGGLIDGPLTGGSRYI